MADEEPDETGGEEVAEDSGPEELSTGLKLGLTDKDVEEIWAADHATQSQLLAKKLRLTRAPTDFRTEVILDFHLYNLVHAQTISLTPRKAAVFHSIMFHVLDQMRQRAQAGKAYSGTDCFAHFQKLMIDHSAPRPPEQIEIFAGTEARHLTDFVSLTLFKQYLLYQYCWVFDREVETLRWQAEMQVPQGPPDLNLAELITEGDGGGDGADADPASKDEAASGAGSKQPSRAPSKQADAGEAAAGAGEEVSSGDAALDALIARKIEEAERNLDAKLAEREANFRARLEARKG